MLSPLLITGTPLPYQQAIMAAPAPAPVTHTKDEVDGFITKIKTNITTLTEGLEKAEKAFFTLILKGMSKVTIDANTAVAAAGGTPATPQDETENKLSEIMSSWNKMKTIQKEITELETHIKTLEEYKNTLTA